MKEPLILYIGTIRRGEFESLLQRDYAIGAIIDTNSAIKLPDLAALRVVEYCNCNHLETELLPLVDRLRQIWDIRCALATHEQYVLHTTHVTQHLHLPGLSFPATQFCLDKTSMHARFVQYLGPDATARFAHVENQEDVRAFAQTVHFPLILKPTNLYNSLFVTLSFSPAELLSNYSQMSSNMQEVLRKTGHSPEHPQIQAEEFLEGTVHSIDCVVDCCGQIMTTPIVDIITGHEIGWNDFHHFARFTPSRLAASQQDALYHLAIEGVRALEITSTVAHVEIIQTMRGPKLLEIGARPGGARAHLLHLSCGFDLMYHYYRVRSGESCHFSPGEGQSTPTAIVTPYSRTAGSLTRINRLADIQRLSSYQTHEQKIMAGQPVGPSTLGYTAPLTIELQSDNPATLLRDIQALQSWSDIFEVADAE